MVAEKLVSGPYQIFSSFASSLFLFSFQTLWYYPRLSSLLNRYLHRLSDAYDLWKFFFHVIAVYGLRRATVVRLPLAAPRASREYGLNRVEQPQVAAPRADCSGARIHWEPPRLRRVRRHAPRCLQGREARRLWVPLHLPLLPSENKEQGGLEAPSHTSRVATWSSTRAPIGRSEEAPTSLHPGTSAWVEWTVGRFSHCGGLSDSQKPFY